MNSPKVIFFSAVTIAALLAFPLTSQAQGRGGHSRGGGSRGSIGAARPSQFAGARHMNRGTNGGQRWSNGGGRRWTGNGGNHWRGRNGNWHHRHHHGHYPRYYYSGYYPYWGYPWGWYGYPYYGASAALYYNGTYNGEYGYGNGNGGDLVAAVQSRLAENGFYKGSIDGVIGNGTRRAIRAFERSNGLPVDGRIDNDLLNRMGLS